MKIALRVYKENDLVNVKGIKNPCVIVAIETDINKINWTSSGSPAFIHVMTEENNAYFLAPVQIQGKATRKDV